MRTDSISALPFRQVKRLICAIQQLCFADCGPWLALTQSDTDCYLLVERRSRLRKLGGKSFRAFFQLPSVAV